MTNAAPSFTPQQAAAIATRDVSVALDAGAGCGKTFVLTERFLSHLAPSETEPASIQPAETLRGLIAITFTKAAAREMRERIRRACHARLAAAGPADAGYWQSLVRALDSAQVTTIDSFCSTLIRQHAVELGVDPAFQVLDEAAAAVLRSESVDSTLRRLLAEGDTGLVSLATEIELRKLKGDLATLALQTTPEVTDAWLDRSPESIVEAWREAYAPRYLPARARSLAAGAAFAAVLNLLPYATPTTGEFEAARSKLLDLHAKLAGGYWSDSAGDRLVELARVKGLCGKDDWPTPDLYKQYQAAASKLRGEAKKKVKPLADEPSALEAAQLGLEHLRLARVIAEDYAAAKAERTVLDFGDLLGGAKRLLTDPELTSARDRLQRNVRLLMVDEFQDTNPTQVEIVKAIVGSGLAEGRLFFVGDFKQSIYRFRGAAPGVFRQLQEETPQAGRLPLSMNFRSQPAVLNFVNTLFAPRFGEGYQPLEAAREQLNDQPSIEFLWTPPIEGGNKALDRLAEARGIAVRLREMIESGEQLVGERADGGWQSRPVQPGDVAILFRALGDVRYYEQALREHDLPYYLVGGHAFYAQQEVYDVANLLRAVASECDDVALAGVLRSPFFSLHDETLFWLAEKNGLSVGLSRRAVPSELSATEAKKLRHARQTLAALRRRKGRAEVAELLTEAIDRTGFDAVLASDFLGERKLANLHKLIEQARQFDRLRPGDLDGFVRQVTDAVSRDTKEAPAATRTGDANEVTLMTIHQSKGLEFPVVVLADLNRRSNDRPDSVALDAALGPVVKTDAEGITGHGIYAAMEADAEAAERDRLLYVACTRAADHLILSAPYAPPAAPEGPLLQTLHERFDLKTGELLGPRTADPPRIRVVQGEPVAPQSSGQRGPSLENLLDEAAANSGGAAPALVQSLSLDPRSVRRFSVTRLTGKLKHTSERPAAIELAEALRPPTEPIDPAAFGSLVHEVIERLPLHEPPTAQSVDDLCGSLAPAYVDRHVDTAASDAARLVNRFVAGKHFARMRSAERVDREVEFLLRWPPDAAPSSRGDAVLQGYIDCLLHTPAGAEVLDFKTNRVDAAAVQSAAEEYRLQLYVYALAVEQATGRPPAALRLLFLRPGVDLAFAWDDAARESVRGMVDTAIARARQEAVQSAAEELNLEALDE
ncbi:MAG: UvrD-helicase domain-containing protein [Planctomycetota bacterium]